MVKWKFHSIRWELVLLVVVLAAGFGLRMIDLTNPPLDFHPDRQLSSGIIARSMYIRMLQNSSQTHHTLAVISSGNSDIYEPPILEGLVALTYFVVGGEHLWIARIYTSLFWIIGGLALYDLVRRMTTAAGGLAALAFYLFVPFGVIASRSFQANPFMIMWMILSLHSLYRWSEDRTWKWALLTGLLTGIAALVKVYVAVFLAPALVAVVLSTEGWKKSIRSLQVWSMAGISIIIPALYYLLFIGARSAGFFVFWALSFTNLLVTPRFYFSWLGMIDQIVGEIVFFASLIGLFLLPPKGRYLALGLWIGYGIFGLLTPVQIYTHDYYSLQLIPIIAISMSALLALVIRQIAQQKVIWQISAAGITLLTLLISAWFARNAIVSQDFSSEAKGWTKMGTELPRDGKIIALTHEYGMRISYYGNIQVAVWPYVLDNNLSALRNGQQGTGFPSSGEFDQYFKTMTDGDRYFLVTRFDELDAQPLLKSKLNNYAIFKQGSGYIIFDLDHPLN